MQRRKLEPEQSIFNLQNKGQRLRGGERKCTHLYHDVAVPHVPLLVPSRAGRMLSGAPFTI